MNVLKRMWREWEFFIWYNWIYPIVKEKLKDDNKR